ncbi:MAG: DM13 domain-containing protein [Bdellovibrionaceae bacterium]|nr:DM13 domain-containing protein [Pseudobdellovibrionaceae bacterium]
MTLHFFKVFIVSLIVGFTAGAQILNNSVIAMGAFKGADSMHKAQGYATLMKVNQGLYVQLDKNFYVSEGPDLFLMLRNSKNAHIGMTILTPLKQYSGAQMFKINISEQDLIKYDQVIIYCKRITTLFAFAPLTFNPNAFLRR